MRSAIPTSITTLPVAYRKQLLEHAQEVNYPEETRLFSEGGRADTFWIVRSGAVSLEYRDPGRRPAVIENLGPGDLVGWSWLYEPYRWHLHATATTPLRTYEFDARNIRMLMDADLAFGFAIDHWVGQILAHRLQSTRVRLLDLYAPHDSGSVM
ncbi:cyclic nucleotide-binding domain-containing protein [Streptomyces boluensis]|uniref:Cyclic nucleotide-binding domain-containing protein n=1 Tax=Streptomyces boluensis TaxID=1775135 RepID=A0A964UJF1_9ACTN|nr:cyclic nucleotide-binding domain-containing protein [Streptomyces boluensis]NBE50264.1 cyclic nucleotide-binding domain-containing protein [Streptomyces boluensis]